MLKGIRWIELGIIVATVILVIILLRFHKSTQVEFEVTAERIDFSVYDPEGSENPVRLVSFLTGSSFKFSNFDPVELNVERIYEINDMSKPPLTNKKIVIKPTDLKFSRLTLKGKNLSLMDLDVRSNAKIMLSVIEEGSIHLSISVESGDSNASPSAPGIEGIISMADQVEALIERCEVVDENGEVLFRESAQRRLLIDPGPSGGNLICRSDSKTSVLVNLTDESATESAKTLRIYDPADNSWTVQHSPWPISIPNAVTAVVDGKIYLIEGVPISDRGGEIKLLNDNLSVTCLNFSRPSLEDPSKEMTTIKAGSIIFPKGELDEIKLKSEFLKFKEDDGFQLLNTSVENGLLRLLLVGRPKSILAGLQQEALNQKLPTTLEWLYTNKRIITVAGILVFVIGLVLKVRTLVLDVRKGKGRNA